MSAAGTSPIADFHAPVDPDAPVAVRVSAAERILRVAIPLVMLLVPIALWQWYVTAWKVPTYRLPAPMLVMNALVNDWPVLSSSLLVTLRIAFLALAIAVVGGLLLAIVLTGSRWVEIALSPYLVFLQVTPLVAAAPLIIVYAPTTEAALLICAWIVCFYPMLSNIMQGLKSTDHNLLNLFELYGASWWQTFVLLRLPAALPYFLTGLRISGGLALIAAVVAEFVAGAAGAGSGLAFRISESGYRLNYPRMFAAFLLVCAAGVAIFCVTSLISYLLLRRWHESAIRRETDMEFGFAGVPVADRFGIANATLPAAVVEGLDGIDAGEGLMRADVVVADGRIDSLRPAGSVTGMPLLDLDRGMAWPCFVDMHTHLDKGHILPRKPNPDGTFDGALAAVHADRDVDWTAADVRTRMEFSIRTAYAHGTKLIRTHINSVPPQFPTSWPVFAEMRDKWAGKVDLQGVGLVPIDLYLDPEFSRTLIGTVESHHGVLGGVTFMIPELSKALDHLFFEAAERGLDIDLHVDETADPNARSLRAVAEAALRIGFEGQVTVGHCCSLARQEEAEADRTMDLVAEAGIAVVSLPMCNLYLQDRHAGRTPRWRGVTLLQELASRGVPTAVASDNTRDPFYAYGDLDAVEVLREAVRILHLDHPLDEAPRNVTSTPADVLRRGDVGRIVVGAPADLVLFRARRWSEFLSRPQSDRTVLRAGRPIDTTLPDYRELDPLFGG